MRIQRPFFASPIVWAGGAAALAVVGTFGLLQANESHKHNAFSEPGKAAFQTAIANVRPRPNIRTMDTWDAILRELVNPKT